MNSTNSSTNEISTFTPSLNDQFILITIVIVILLIGLVAVFDALLFRNCECTNVNTTPNNDDLALYALKRKLEDKPNNSWENSKKKKNNPETFEFYIDRKYKVSKPQTDCQLIDLDKP